MKPRLLTTALAVVLLLCAGCSDDDCLSCPDPEEGLENHPTITNVWPNTDGNTWIYNDLTRAFESDPDEEYDPEGPPPPLPDMETLHARLAEAVPFALVGNSTGLYRMSFDGNVTTDSGVTAQHVREELFDPAVGKTMLPTHDPRLRELVLATRSGLRTNAESKPSDKAAGDELEAPILMGGYAFAATDMGLYGYGDINTDTSWLYLESDLNVGHEFSMQLVPDLSDDVYLYGRIWSVDDLEIDGHTYRNCVECFYVIDMGVNFAVDENATLLYQKRSYIYGSVYYAPNVGPVRCHQRSHLSGAGILQDDAFGIIEILVDISGVEVTAP